MPGATELSLRPVIGWIGKITRDNLGREARPTTPALAAENKRSLPPRLWFGNDMYSTTPSPNSTYNSVQFCCFWIFIL